MKLNSHRGSRRKLVGIGLALAFAFVGLFAGTGSFIPFKPISVTSSQGSCSFTSDYSAIQCRLGEIKSGGNASIQLVVLPTTPGVLTDTATATGRESDRNPGNNTDSVTTRVNGPPEKVADLSVTKAAAPDPAVVGRTLTYTLVVKNNGPDKATGVVLNDTLPLQVTLGNVRASQGTCELRNGQIHCELGSINNGGQATVTLVVVPTSNGMVFNEACAFGNEFDPNYTYNCAAASVIVRLASADLQVDKQGPATATVNQPVTYNIVVTNNGPDDATGVELRDNLH